VTQASVPAAVDVSGVAVDVPGVAVAPAVVVADAAVPGALWLPHAVSISPQAAARAPAAAR
jgi:hypothetical protein